MKYFLIISSLFLSSYGFSQSKDAVKALLIIDIQEFYFPGGNWELESPGLAVDNAAILLEQFRKDGDLVIHIKHLTESGGNIHQLVQPLDNETVITKKDINSFKDTALLELLNNRDVASIVLCGMQTHMCLEAATRAAADYGFQCTVISDACTTRDLEYEGQVVKAAEVHLSTLATLRSYAKVVTTETYLETQ